MTQTSSPYAVYRADEWVPDVAKPIGIGQGLRLSPKKFSPMKSPLYRKNGCSSKKAFSKSYVQLAFA